MHRYVNIDREQWWDVTGAGETGVVDVARVPQVAVDALRRVFLRSGDRDSAAWLDGIRVLVVDEVINTGDTLMIAENLFRRAFPQAEVRGTHWMRPGLVVDRSGQRRTAEVPVWYRSDTWAGRLVGNRFAPGARPVTERSRNGALFLSTRPPQPDGAGVQLKREVARLAQDVRAGRLLARPAMGRDDQDWAERVSALYGFDNLAAFTRARAAQDRL
jgi:hypothetical protein